MAITFPDINPTERRFTGPRWPTTSVRSQSGVRTTRLWGSLPSELELDLRFDNVTDANAALIMKASYDAKGNTLDLILPPSIFEGAGSDLKGWINADQYPGLKWYFADEPVSGESVIPGRTSLQVRLVAELRMN